LNIVIHPSLGASFN